MRQALAALEGQRVHVKRDGHHIAEHVWVTVPDVVARQQLVRGTWVEFDARVVRYFKPRMSGTWHDFTLADVVNFRKAHEEKISEPNQR